MRLYFIRHGESEANVTGVFSNRPPGLPLTAAGRAQAQALAAQLRHEGLTAIYSSPLQRAQETARTLAAPLGLSVTTTDALREYDTGIYEGTAEPAHWEANAQLFQAWVVERQWQLRIEGGESFDDMRARFAPFIAGLLAAADHGDARVALVGHGGLFLAQLPLLLANAPYAWALQHPLGNTAYVVAETRGDALHCLSWGGLSPDGAA